MKIRFILYFVLFFLVLNLKSQTPSGDIADFKVLQNEDTLKITRSYSDFWFGINAGGNMNYYLGQFQYVVNPQYAYDSLLNPLISYNGTYGYGLNFGFVFEYLPKNEFYGLGLRINVIENRIVDMAGNSVNLANPESYNIQGLMNYISIAPTFRFSLPIYDLYVFGGPIFELRQSNDIIHYTNFDNVSEIRQERRIGVQNIQNRLGFQGGIGFEFLVADVEDLFRIKMSPYISFASGQNIFGEQIYDNKVTSPSINTIMVQGGIKLKIGVDEVRYDTLKLDPNYIPPSQSYASAMDEKGLSVEGFLKKELVEISRIDLVEKGKIKEQVREEPVFAQEQARAQQVEQPRFTRADITTNKKKIMQYATSNTTDLSKDMQDYLSALAEYMKANPNTEARLIGHTDNVGTEDEKQRISKQRATVAKRFLMSKGINGTRILADGKGDRETIADARTPEGRRKNRRLEIEVVNK